MRLAIEDQFKRYLQDGTFVFVNMNGSKVPFRITDTEDGAHYVIGIEEISNKQESDQLSGLDLWVPLDTVKPRHQRSPRNLQDKWNEYQLLDVHSNDVYPIERVEEFPQQLMAVIIHDSKEKLIPLSDQLITSIDKAKKIITIEIPEGLLEI